VHAADSSFLLGSTGAGDAQLSINGAPVRVWPNGAWIAWVRLPPDSIVRFELRARTPRDSAMLVHEVRRHPAVAAPPAAAVWVDTTALYPRGELWVERGELVELAARATPGVQVQLRLTGGTGDVAPLVPDQRPQPVPRTVRAFEWDTLTLRTLPGDDRYRGVLRAPLVAPFAFPGVDRPLLEAIRGADTVRVPWPLRLMLLDDIPPVVVLDDDPERTGKGDGITVGRAAPGATYNWFFPAGTRAVVSGRMNDELRLRLAPELDVWIPAAEARELPRGTPPPRARVEALTLTPADDRVLVRIPLGEPVPFRVEEGEHAISVMLYGAEGDVDWIRYGRSEADTLVRRVDWSQLPGRVVRLDIEMAHQVWGYRTRWSGTDLILEIRRPPKIDSGNPLEGRLIAVDPGHPPLGSTGPTGLREADANLAVSLALARMLEDEGARVILTRPTDAAVELARRVPIADSAGAELLVSIHQNALPDGVNPFPNHGASVFYNHVRSLPLARAIQRRLVERLGVRDLGVARADLAVTRATWMPAVLTEGLHIIMPEHEAALRTEKGRELYARGVMEGIRDYLKAVRGEE
jgi:N-acetylmuramoyl-L-alanine amidase